MGAVQHAAPPCPLSPVPLGSDELDPVALLTRARENLCLALLSEDFKGLAQYRIRQQVELYARAGAGVASGSTLEDEIDVHRVACAGPGRRL